MVVGVVVVALGWVVVVRLHCGLGGVVLWVPLVLKLFLCWGGSNLRTGRENQIFYSENSSHGKVFSPNCQKITWGHNGGV